MNQVTIEKQQERALKAFRKFVMTKNILSWENDQNGFLHITYNNGQVFKCKGEIVKMAGLQ